MILDEILQKIDLQQSLSKKDFIGLNTLDNASSLEISFFDNKKYINSLKHTKAGALFIKEEFVEYVPSSTIAIITDEPYLNMAYTTKLFIKPLVSKDIIEPLIGKNCNIQDNVHIGQNVIIGNSVTILAGAFIGDRSIIGDNVIIYPNVTIYNDTKIGDDVIIHAGAVIGSDGFGYAYTKSRIPIKIYHLGSVLIENNVEIGANTTIDRAVFSETIIKANSKLDNQIMIAHNVQIGEKCIIAGQVGIAGSSIIHDSVTFGAQAGVAGHLSIDSNSVIYAKAGVTKDLQSGQYAGFPIMGHKEWLKKEAKLNKLIKK